MCRTWGYDDPFHFPSFNDDNTIKKRIYECLPVSHSIFFHDSRLSFLSDDLEEIALLFVRKQDSKLDANRLSGITRAASKISCLRYLHLIRSHTFAGIPKRLRQISINYRYVSRISRISSFAYWDKLQMHACLYLRNKILNHKIWSEKIKFQTLKLQTKFYIKNSHFKNFSLYIIFYDIDLILF